MPRKCPTLDIRLIKDCPVSVSSRPPFQEADRRILAALMEGEEEGRRVESARRERAVADVAWMKRVLEEQLQLEREREAEFDLLYRLGGGARGGASFILGFTCDGVRIKSFPFLDYYVSRLSSSTLCVCACVCLWSNQRGGTEGVGSA